MKAYAKMLSRASSNGALSTTLAGTAMLVLLLGQALESSAHGLFTIVPFGTVLVCLWAPLFRRGSSGTSDSQPTR